MGRAHCLVEAVLLEFLFRQNVRIDSKIAVGLSGGPDSMALLAALCAIGWKRPIAVHVDHGIRSRDELSAERRLVERVCSSLGARLIQAHVRPGAVLMRSEVTGEGVEAEARHYRYRVFQTVARRTGVAAFLIGHTRDDQIETLLMRIFGGSGGGGLGGIPETSGMFMRPFLGIEKEALLSYLEERGMPFSTDSTNVSNDFLRNRIRSTVVPALDASFRGWRTGLALTASKSARDEKALSDAADVLAFSPSLPPMTEFTLPASQLLDAPEAVAIRSIVSAAGKLLDKKRLSSSMASAALKALRHGEGTGYRGAGLELCIVQGLVILRRGLDFPWRGGYFVVIDRPRRVRVGSLEVRAEWDLGGRAGIRADAFSFPLVVRSRRPGDAISLKDGTKRLDTLFSEWALPEDARRAVPIVEDRDGLVVVFAESLGGKDRFRAGSSGECGRRLSVIVKGA